MVEASVVLTYLKQRDEWLIGVDVGQLTDLTEALFEQLIIQQPRPKILLAEPDPLRFLASFLAAVAAECPIFLCNPHWKQQEWQQVFNLVQPDLIWGTIPVSVPPASISTPASAQIMLPTGGSSGKIRFAVHTWETLTASVQGFHRYFGSVAINSFCVLPLYHVSGLMQFMRSFLTGGQLLIGDYSAFKNNQFDRQSINPAEFFISLVPTQLQYLLQVNPQWLSRFHTVLLGGAPAWRSLLETARNYRIRLAPTYGMTETASQVVTLKPNDFLCGLNSSGQVLPHAQVNITNTAGFNQPGIITIQADSLCLGYYSDQTFNGQFQTDDLGFFDAEGYLHIVGRSSQKIITGGENVFPAEVEAAILATQLVSDVCVIGVPDSQWGQAVTAVYVSQSDSHPEIQVALKEKLSRFKQPKYWFRVAHLPRNAQGKVNFKEVKSMVLRLINSQEKEM